MFTLLVAGRSQITAPPRGGPAALRLDLTGLLPSRLPSEDSFIMG